MLVQDSFDIKVNYFTTEWIMALFLNSIPLDINVSLESVTAIAHIPE